ncbi:hypothetical protein CA13_60590 [Planctomycetes bacterium CA13]|uniref:Uncharacterized protein n=1 Tax=Novipirellula herctigrandis TaxID=2527986 RepID=A0A5C5ZB31_9BACT|nr:hypothetical protein CA13_60590 [Planctomycetes bacterium CA13]
MKREMQKRLFRNEVPFVSATEAGYGVIDRLRLPPLLRGAGCVQSRIPFATAFTSSRDYDLR